MASGRRPSAYRWPAHAVRRTPGGALSSDGRRVAWCSREDSVELAARADVELREDLLQVILNGAGADEQPCADLGVGKSVASHLRDLVLLRGEVVACLLAPFAH